MKKIITGVILTAISLTMGTAGTIFGTSDNNYTDADNNGICDNISISSNSGTGRKNGQNCNGGTGASYTDADNDGVCDNAGTGRKNGQNCNAGTGAGYTDADNDGVCDNAGINNFNKGGKCRRSQK